MDCASITNQQVIDLLFVIAPQFYTTDVTKLAGYNTLIDALRCMINCAALGCCALLAFANLLAHYLTMQNNPSMGITTNISEGQLSLGIAATVNAGFYQSSPYGQAYWSFVSRFKVGAYVTNSRHIGAWGGVGFGGWYGPSCGC